MGSPGGPSHFRVALVGVGSIGQALLARADLPEGCVFTLIDGDTVEAGNLGRQVLCREQDLGRPKTEVVSDHLAARRFPHHAVPRFLDPGNAIDLLSGHDLVVDACDDLHARYLVDRTCGALGIPLISGAVHANEGQVVLLHAPAPSLKDVFAGRPSGEQDGCDMRRVPLELIAHVSETMLALLQAVMNNDPSEAGVLQLIAADGVMHRFHTLERSSS
ncbi:MAG: ThiF family adenylyltransferase [Flavobacteriales bacterium]